MFFVIPVLGGLGALIATMAAAHASKKIITHEHPIGLPGYPQPLPRPGAAAPASSSWDGQLARYRTMYAANPRDARIPLFVRQLLAQEQAGGAAVPGQPYTPSSVPSTPSTPAAQPSQPAITPDMISRVKAWLDANVPPEQDAALSRQYQALAVGLGRAPTAAELCGILQSGLTPAQMASLVQSVPEFSACVVPGTVAAPSAPPAPVAPAGPAVVPTAEPGMPAPPPTASTTTAPAEPTAPAIDVSQPTPGTPAAPAPFHYVPPQDYFPAPDAVPPPVPTPGVPLPTGFNEALARQLAPQVEANIKAKKANYDRALLKQFQSAAGLTPDGFYGGYSAGALRYFLNRTPPKALVKPTAEKAYKLPTGAAPVVVTTPAAQPSVPVTQLPPPVPTPIPTLPGLNLPLASQLAVQVEANIKSKKANYDRTLLKQFQSAAGLTVDGLYGGSSAGALRYFLHRAPPKALVAPLTEKPYAAASMPAVPALPATPAAATPAVPVTPAAQPVPAAPAPALPGLNLSLASQLAPVVESNLIVQKANYDHALLKKFQSAAGLTVDGLYGGSSAGALRYFLHRAPPKALFAPLTEKPYAPASATPAAPSASVPVMPSVQPGMPAPAPAAQAVPAAAPVEVQQAVAPTGVVDVAHAKQLASQVEANIKSKKANYDRALLKQFQTAAGLTPDGLYGGYSAGALRYFLGHAPPKPLVQPSIEKPYALPAVAAAPAAAPYVPQHEVLLAPAPAAAPAPAPAPVPAAVPDVLPATGVNTATALALAPQVAADITANKFNYSRPLLQHFQQAAGVLADGLYGGGSAGALRYYLHAAPPKALFAPTIEKPYSPPAGAPGAAPQPMPAPLATPAQSTLTPAQAAVALRDYLAKSGDFGSKAHPSSIVAQYQGQIGTSADGIVGPKTRTAASKYGVTLPTAGATSGASATTADLLKLPPSLVLALRSMFPPAPEGAASGDIAPFPPLTLQQLSPIITVMGQWMKMNVGPVQEAKMFSELQKLGHELGVNVTLPLSYEAAERLAKHPALACGILTKTLGQKKIDSLLATVPTMKARWALYCANQLQMPGGFDAAIWSEATDEQRKEIVQNWLPGVQVVAQAKVAESPVRGLSTAAYARARAWVEKHPELKSELDDTDVILEQLAAQKGFVDVNDYCGALKGALRPEQLASFLQAVPELTQLCLDVQPITADNISEASTLAPWGYDASKDRTLAREVVRNVQARSFDYDRGLLKKFQTAAGLKADGLYGGRVVGALKFYGAARAPKALIEPKAEQSYAPPA